MVAMESANIPPRLEEAPLCQAFVDANFVATAVRVRPKQGAAESHNDVTPTGCPGADAGGANDVRADADAAEAQDRAGRGLLRSDGCRRRRTCRRGCGLAGGSERCKRRLERRGRTAW
jgi:hypothetical protein